MLVVRLVHGEFVYRHVERYIYLSVTNFFEVMASALFSIIFFTVPPITRDKFRARKIALQKSLQGFHCLPG